MDPQARLDLESRVSDPAVLLTIACITDKNDEACYVNIRESGGCWWVTNLHTLPEFRRIDLAEKTMKKMTSFWDTYIKEDLYLQVMPFTNRPVTDRFLTEFYARFGFSETGVPGVLVRSRLV